MPIQNSDGSIILDTKVNTSGINRGINSMKNGLNSLFPIVSRLGAMLGGIFAVSGLISFGKEAVNLASDIEEVQNVVDVAFGDMKQKMEDFADTAIDKFGMSRLVAKQAGSSFMSMAKGIGIAEEEASEMAISLTGLVGDMASFYNITHDEARTALASIFTGETETLKRFGVVMTEINLQEFARQKGIKKTISAMTQQEKTMLRYNFVLEKTAIAQGDFVRTQDSWANKLRTLQERWKEMQVALGEALIILLDEIMPVIEKIMKALTIAALYFAAFARGMKNATDSSKEFAETSEKTALTTQELAKATFKERQQLELMGEAFEEVSEATKEANRELAAFDEITTLSSGSTVADNIIGDSSFDIFPSDFSENMDKLSSFIGEETYKDIEEFENWVRNNKDNIKSAIDVAGYSAIAIGIAGVITKIGRLVSAFGRKDDALDKQSKKLQTESSLVGDLIGDLAKLGLGALGLGGALGWLNGVLGGSPEGTAARVGALSPVTAEAADKTKNLGEESVITAEEIVGVKKAEEEAATEATILADSLVTVENKSQVAQSGLESLKAETISIKQKLRDLEDQAIDTADALAAVGFSQVEKSGINELRNELFGVKQSSRSSEIQNRFDALKIPFSESDLYVDPNIETNIDYQTAISLDYNDALKPLWTSEDTYQLLGYLFSDEFMKRLKNAFSYVPSILPAYATGGIVPHATVGLIGEAGKEAVLPLENNTEWMDILADRIIARQGISGGNTEVVLELNGRELGRAIVEQGNRENRRIGTRLVVAR